MPETIALTGATGFVGYHVAMGLKNTGLDVRLLVRKPRAVQWLAGFEVIKGALEDEEALKWLTDGAFAVVHCAGAIKARRGAEFDRVNAVGTKAVVEAALAAGVNRFVHLSSLAAREPGLSPYGASKRKSELAVRQAEDSMACTILRPPVIYGPGDQATLGLFKQMLSKRAIVPGSARTRISMLYVEDLARAILQLVSGEQRVRGIYEIADGRAGGYRWPDLAGIAGRSQGREVSLMFLPPALVWGAAYLAQFWGMISGSAQILSPGKAAELYHEDWVCHGNLLEESLDWMPEVDFARGFDLTLAWYRRENWLS